MRKLLPIKNTPQGLPGNYDGRLMAIRQYHIEGS